jgi:hypothetical protein
MLTGALDARRRGRGRLDQAIRRLSDRQYSPGPGMDLWILGLHLAGMSSILGAINFVVTVHNLRAPGLSFLKMPLFCWNVLITLYIILFGTPVLAGALTMLLTDRMFGTGFFHPAAGGESRPLGSTSSGSIPSRGLHHGAPRDGRDLAGAPSVRLEAAVRVQGDGARDARGSVSLDFSSGTTTCSRAASTRTCAGSSASCPWSIAVHDRHQDLVLARDRVGCSIRFRTPMLYGLGFISLIHDRRDSRACGSRWFRSTCKSTTRTSSWRTSTTSFSAARSWGSSRGLLLVPEMSGRMYNGQGQGALLVHVELA